MSRRQGGDGDPCPIDREHGRMTFMQPPSTRQYCGHQSHDGTWSGKTKQDPTPCFWPKGTSALAAAVAEYNRVSSGEAVAALPDIDMEALLA